MFGKISHLNVVSDQFHKNFKGLLFCGGSSKNLKLSTKAFFGVSFQKNVLSSFMLFSYICYQDELSDTERNEMSVTSAITDSYMSNFQKR